MSAADPREENVWAPTQFLTRTTKRPGLLVILAGLVTTAATLALLSLLGRVGFSPMGYYVNLIPFGALLVGMLAGSGYGLASWFSGAKMGWVLVAIVAVLQIGGYFAAQYVEYAQLRAGGVIPQEAGFLDYFDAITQSFTFQNMRHNNDKPGEAWGEWGYLLRLAEIAGFACGGALAPIMLFNVPYCDECQVYKNSYRLGHLPAGAPTKKLGKRKRAGGGGFQTGQTAARQEGLARSEELSALVRQTDIAGLGEFLRQYSVPRRDAIKLTSHVQVRLVHCGRCHAGEVAASLVTAKSETPPRELWQAPVDPQFVTQALQLPKKS